MLVIITFTRIKYTKKSLPQHFSYWTVAQQLPRAPIRLILFKALITIRREPHVCSTKLGSLPTQALLRCVVILLGSSIRPTTTKQQDDRADVGIGYYRGELENPVRIA